MSDDGKNRPVFPAFGGASNKTEKRPMPFCVLTNVGNYFKIPDMETRAELYVRNPDMEYVGAVKGYVESGISPLNFQGMVAYYLSAYIHNGYARDLQFVNQDCAVFEADQAILQQLRQTFPLNRFSFGIFTGSAERDEAIRHYQMFREASAVNKDLILPRPYLDS